MEKGAGLSPFKAEFPRRYFDVGIAEEHAVTFAAGLAAQGLRPVAAIYSTFMQRGMDQVIHDAAIPGLPVTFALDRSGFVGDDGETHQGLFDISLFRPVPGMTILAPATAGELAAMLDWSLSREGPEAQGPLGPCMIRYPKAFCPQEEAPFAAPLVTGRGVFVREGVSSSKRSFRERSPVCLAFTGSLYPEALEAADVLSSQGIGADLYNLRFLKPIDEAWLAAIMTRYELVVFIEEGVRNGGFGEFAADLAVRYHCSSRFLSLAAQDRFMPQGTRAELLQWNGLDGPGIAASVSALYQDAAPISFPRIAAR
jgi:1-deoxy-D-xylulose-5-phosphate synthase